MKRVSSFGRFLLCAEARAAALHLYGGAGGRLTEADVGAVVKAFARGLRDSCEATQIVGGAVADVGPEAVAE